MIVRNLRSKFQQKGLLVRFRVTEIGESFHNGFHMVGYVQLLEKRKEIEDI